MKTRTRLPLFTLFLTGLMLMFSFSAFADKTLTAASDPWPPFVDPQHPKEGLSLEIIRAAFQTQGYTIKMEYVP